MRFATFHEKVTLLYEKLFSTQMKVFTDENLCNGKNRVDHVLLK